MDKKIPAIRIDNDEGNPSISWRLDVAEQAVNFFSYIKDNEDVGTKLTFEVVEYTPEEWKEIEEFDAW